MKEYTLEHMRAFGMYNYLHLDPWYEDSVLFVDCKGRVLSLTVILVSYEIIPNKMVCFKMIIYFLLLLLFCYMTPNHETFDLDTVL